MGGGGNEKYPLIGDCLGTLDTGITEEICIRVAKSVLVALMDGELHVLPP